jgi:hypothetical protein
MGQVGFREAIGRANSHIRYWQYRQSIGAPIRLIVAIRQWWSRLLFEWLGRGNGA